MRTIDELHRLCRSQPHFHGQGAVKVMLKNGERWNFYADIAPTFIMLPHDHRVSFRSKIMKGQLRHVLYDVTPADEETGLQLVANDCDGTDSRIVMEDVHLRKTMEMVHSEGQEYWLDRTQVHEVFLDSPKAITCIEWTGDRKQDCLFVVEKGEPWVCAFSQRKEKSECWQIIKHCMTP